MKLNALAIGSYESSVLDAGTLVESQSIHSGCTLEQLRNARSECQRPTEIDSFAFQEVI